MSVRTSTTSAHRALNSCVAALEGVAFWTSVLVPLTYPPLLVALASASVPPWFLPVVVAANALALVLGHGYNRGTARPSSGEQTEPADGEERA